MRRLLSALSLAPFAAVLAASAHAETRLGIEGSRFTLDGAPTFLLGVSYYGGLAAPEESVRADLDDLARQGLNWIRVWATWASDGEICSAVSTDGSAREPWLSALERLVVAADERGIVVDVTLSRGEAEGGFIPDFAGHLRACTTLAEALRSHGNVYMDIANERDIRDARYVGIEEMAAIREAIRAIAPEMPVTASGVGDAERDELEGLLGEARLDFLCPHRGRHPASPAETEGYTERLLADLADLGLEAPIHYQEPFRRDYGSWQPTEEDFLTDLAGAVRGGAAGWCLHNGSPRGGAPEGPARSFDLRPGRPRLCEQLDPVERAVLARMAEVARSEGALGL